MAEATLNNGPKDPLREASKKPKWSIPVFDLSKVKKSGNATENTEKIKNPGNGKEPKRTEPVRTEIVQDNTPPPTPPQEGGEQTSVGMGDLKQAEANDNTGILNQERPENYTRSLNDLYVTPSDATKAPVYDYKKLDNLPITKKVYKQRINNPDNTEPTYPIAPAEETPSGSIIPKDIAPEMSAAEEQSRNETLNKINSGEINLPTFVKYLPENEQLSYVGATYNNNPLYSALTTLIEPLLHLENLGRTGVNKATGSDFKMLDTPNMSAEDEDDKLITGGADLLTSLIPLGVSMKFAGLLLKGIKNPFVRNMLSSGLGFLINSQPAYLDNLTQGKMELKDYAIGSMKDFVTGVSFGAVPHGTALKYLIPYQAVVPTMVPVISDLIEGKEVNEEEIIHGFVSNVILGMVMNGQLPKNTKVNDVTRAVKNELGKYAPEQVTPEVVNNVIAGLLPPARVENSETISRIKRNPKDPNDPNEPPAGGNTIEQVKIPGDKSRIVIDEQGNAKVEAEKEAEPYIAPVKLTPEQYSDMKNNGMTDAEIQAAQESLNKPVYPKTPKLQQKVETGPKEQELIDKGNKFVEEVKPDEVIPDKIMEALDEAGIEAKVLTGADGNKLIRVKGSDKVIDIGGKEDTGSGYSIKYDQNKKGMQVGDELIKIEDIDNNTIADKIAEKVVRDYKEQSKDNIATEDTEKSKSEGFGKDQEPSVPEVKQEAKQETKEEYKSRMIQAAKDLREKYNNKEISKQVYDRELDKLKKDVIENKKKKPAEQIIAETPRGELPDNISEKIKNNAEEKLMHIESAEIVSERKYSEQDDITGEQRRRSSPFTMSSFPGWFSDLGKNKQTVINALKKIIEDNGKDTGKAVEEMKAVILKHLKEGATEKEMEGFTSISGRMRKGNSEKIAIPKDQEVADFLEQFKGDVKPEDLQKAVKDGEKDVEDFFKSKQVKPIDKTKEKAELVDTKTVKQDGKKEEIVNQEKNKSKSEKSELFQERANVFEKMTLPQIRRYINDKAKEIGSRVDYLQSAEYKEIVKPQLDKLLHRENAKVNEEVRYHKEKLKNKIITKDQYDQAILNIKERGKRMYSTPIDPAALKDLAVVGLYHFEGGVRKFADWSKRMVDELGDKVKPYLKDLWNKARGESDLIARHNLFESKLKFSDEMGGIANPSIAITKKGLPFESFGDITLIGSKHLIDPQYSKDTKVFGADVYSPRYPDIHADINYNKFKELNDKVYKSYTKYLEIPEWRGNNALDMQNFKEYKKDTFSRDQYFEIYYLDEIAKEKIEKTDYKSIKALLDKHRAEYSDFIDKTFNDIVIKKKLFKGFNYNGDRQYSEYTLKNISKELKKNLRGGENFVYGVGNLRSVVAPKYNKINDIVKNKNKIVDEGVFDKIKEETDKELFDLIDTYSYDNRGSFGSADNFINILQDGIKGKRNLVKELEEYGFKDGDTNKLYDFLKKLKDLPTEYFETIITRPVGIGEFKAAVIPEDASKNTIDILEKNGITDIRRYKDNAERQSIIENMDEHSFGEQIQYEKYYKALNKLRTKLSGKVNMTFGLDALPELFTIGKYHLEKGAVKFKDWAVKMVKELGDKVKPYLKKVWEELTKNRTSIDNIVTQGYAGRKALGYEKAKEEGKVFKNPYDKQERFEIDDSEAKVKEDFYKRREDLAIEKKERTAKLLAENPGSDLVDLALRDNKEAQSILDLQDKIDENTFPLHKVLDHKELFENYPQFNNMKVEFSTFPLLGDASYNPVTKTISINNRALDSKSMLLHEIQHAIQEVEGFAKGGNIAMFEGPTKSDLKDFIDKVKDELLFITNSAERYKMSLKDAYDNYKNAIRDPEVKKAVENKINSSSLEQIQEDLKWLKRSNRTPLQKYKHLAGEIEARDVQSRMDLTKEQRDPNHPDYVGPYSSENIAPEDAIMYNGDGISNSMKLKEKDGEAETFEQYKKRIAKEYGSVPTREEYNDAVQLKITNEKLRDKAETDKVKTELKDVLDEVTGDKSESKGLTFDDMKSRRSGRRSKNVPANENFMNNVYKKVDEITREMEQKGFKGQALMNQAEIQSINHVFNNDPAFKKFNSQQKKAILRELKNHFKEEYRKRTASTAILGEEYTDKNLWERIKNAGLLQSLTVLEKQGPTGKEMSERFKDMADHERELMGEPSGLIIDIAGLNKAERHNLEKIWESKMNENLPPNYLNDNVKNVDSKINDYFDRMAGEYQKRGFLTRNKLTGDVYAFTPKKDYRPRILNDKINQIEYKEDKSGIPKNNPAREKVIDFLVESKQAKDRAAAALLLDNELVKHRIRKAGNVEYSRNESLRLPDEYYVTDPAESLISYSKKVAKRVAFVDSWGMDGQIFNRLRDDLYKQGKDYQRAHDLFRYETGQLTAKERKALHDVNTVKAIQALTKFTPFTSLRNAFQGFLGTTTRGNLKAGFAGLVKSLTPKMRRYAYESGAMADNLEGYFKEAVSGDGNNFIGKMTSKYLDAIQFTSTDRYNRVVSAVGGLTFMEDMLKRIQKDSIWKRRAFREFKLMKIDPDKAIENGGFTQVEKNRIMRTFAYDTQFAMRPQNLPLWWSSPHGKLVTQWKPWGYKMTQLIRDNVIKEIRHGNVLPFITLLTAYGVAGETANYIIDSIRSVANFNPRDDKPTNANENSLLFKIKEGDVNGVISRILDDLGGLGAISMYWDIARSFGYGKSGKSISTFIGPAQAEGIDIMNNVFGPFATKLTNNTEDTWSETGKKEIQGIYKSATGNVPGAGLFRTLGLTKLAEEKIFGKSGKSNTIKSEYKEGLDDAGKEEMDRINKADKELKEFKEMVLENPTKELQRELDKRENEVLRMKDKSRVWNGYSQEKSKRSTDRKQLLGK